MSQPQPRPAPDPTAAAPTYFADEFDVRSFLSIVLRRWWIILLFVLIPAAVALIIVLLGEETYTATADVSLLNVRSVVTFDPDFTTVPEEAPPFGTDTGTREQALFALATSKSLVLEIYQQLQGEIPAQKTPFATMNEAMQVQNLGDLLRFSATWTEPEAAALIANAWAQSFVKTANQSYVTFGSRNSDEARATAATAFAAYEKDQSALEAFINTDAASELERQLAATDALLEEIQARQDENLRLRLATDLITANSLAESTRTAYLDQLAYALSRQSEDRQLALNDWYERRAALQRLQLRLNDLRSQVEQGAESAAAVNGDALALLFIRAGLFGEDTLPGLMLQLDPNTIAGGQPATTADVDELVAVVAAGLDQATQEIDQLTEQMFAAADMQRPDGANADIRAAIETQVNEILQDTDTPPTASTTPATIAILAELTAQRQRIMAQQETQSARLRELTRQRDSSWNLYETLDNKAREVEAQFAAGAPQARIAISAVPPLYRDPRNTVSRVAAAAVMGAILGILFVTSRAYWTRRPTDE